jgi:hypothetical protein
LSSFDSVGAGVCARPVAACAAGAAVADFSCPCTVVKLDVANPSIAIVQAPTMRAKVW